MCMCVTRCGQEGAMVSGQEVAAQLSTVNAVCVHGPESPEPRQDLR